MTKRALAVIAVLFLIPVIAGCVFFVKWKNRNPVVAEYGSSIDEIIYRNDTYYKVEGSEELPFELGKFLGKIGDRLTGSPIYLVKNDESEGYLAVSGNDGIVLFTKSGILLGEEKADSRITAISVNSFSVRIDDREKIDALGEIFERGTNVDFIPGSYLEKDAKGQTNLQKGLSLPGFKVWRLDGCVDGSAIATKKIGWILKIDKKNVWLFVTDEAAAECEQGIEDGLIEERCYKAAEIDEISGIRLLNSIFEPGDTASGTSVDTLPDTAG